MGWERRTRVSRRHMGALLFGAAALGTNSAAYAGNPATDGLPRARPEDHGVDPAAIAGWLDELTAADLELHSFMLARHGHVVAEGWWWPYQAGRRHMMHSLTKSVTACGVGLALDEGRFKLSDQVVSFFLEHLPKTIGNNLAAMTVEHLLTMRTGHVRETSGAVWRPIPTSWVAEFFKIPVDEKPGAKFLYTSAATYMLSAIITKTTGLSLRDYLEPRLLKPLGITELDWDVGPENINPGANGLNWRTSDTLKLAMLHLQNGQWNGRRILPRAWVAAATRRQAGNEEYGYQWWIGPGDIFYALGKFCQVGMAFPDHDAVLAITAANGKNSPILDRIWNYFPAGFGGATTPGAADVALERRMAAMRLLPKPERKASPLEQRLTNAHFIAAPNEEGVKALRFQFTGDRCRFSQTDERGTHEIAMGLSGWVEGETSMSGAKLHHEYESRRMPLVAAATWQDDKTLEMTWQFIETAFRDRIVCRFDGPNLTFDRRLDVHDTDLSLPTLRASRA